MIHTVLIQEEVTIYTRHFEDMKTRILGQNPWSTHEKQGKTCQIQASPFFNNNQKIHNNNNKPPVCRNQTKYKSPLIPYFCE